MSVTKKNEILFLRRTTAVSFASGTVSGSENSCTVGLVANWLCKELDRLQQFLERYSFAFTHSRSISSTAAILKIKVSYSPANNAVTSAPIKVKVKVKVNVDLYSASS